MAAAQAKKLNSKKAGKKNGKKSNKTAQKKSRSGAKVGAPSLKLGHEIWPLERDVLFRPDRLKYVRKLIVKEGCVFCSAAQAPESFETLCVYKTLHSMVVINKFPYNSGHVLVIPLQHKGQMFDLQEEAFTDLHQTLRLAMKAVYETYNPAGMNVGLNHGQVAGAGIPDHLHYHLIPRWAGDLNFFPLIAETRVVIETLDQTYERLKQFFQKNSSTRNKEGS